MWNGWPCGRWRGLVMGVIDEVAQVVCVLQPRWTLAITSSSRSTRLVGRERMRPPEQTAELL